MVSKEINEIKLENYQKYDPNLARCVIVDLASKDEELFTKAIEKMSSSDCDETITQPTRRKSLPIKISASNLKDGHLIKELLLEKKSIETQNIKEKHKRNSLSSSGINLQSNFVQLAVKHLTQDSKDDIKQKRTFEQLTEKDESISTRDFLSNCSKFQPVVRLNILDSKTLTNLTNGINQSRCSLGIKSTSSTRFNKRIVEEDKKDEKATGETIRNDETSKNRFVLPNQQQTKSKSDQNCFSVPDSLLADKTFSVMENDKIEHRKQKHRFKRKSTSIDINPDGLKESQSSGTSTRHKDITPTTSKAICKRSTKKVGKKKPLNCLKEPKSEGNGYASEDRISTQFSNRTSKKKGGLLIHYSIRDYVGLYKCDVCGKTSSEPIDIQLHICVDAEFELERS